MNENILLTSIIGCGTVGNFLSIGVFSRKAFNKMNVRNMFIVYLVVEIIGLVTILPSLYKSNIQFFKTTEYCRFIQTISYVLPAYKAWILVFISIERYISIKYSTQSISKLFKNKAFQLISLFIIFLICLFWYCKIWLEYEIKFYKFVNSTLVRSSERTNIAACVLNAQSMLEIYIMDMPFSIFVPFLLLIACSIIIIWTMRQVRIRLNQHSTEINKKREKRNLNYAKTILSLDIIFLLFNFPYGFLQIIGNYIEYDWTAALVLFYIYYIGFGINFFTYLAFNKTFRRESYKCLKLLECLIPETDSFRK